MENEILKIIIGIVCVIIGPYLVLYYQKLKRENKAGGLSFKFQSVGIALFLGGIILIFQGLINISVK